jgi:hypothetical protein
LASSGSVSWSDNSSPVSVATFIPTSFSRNSGERGTMLKNHSLLLVSGCR